MENCYVIVIVADNLKVLYILMVGSIMVKCSFIMVTFDGYRMVNNH